jgi:hypothetical protein
MEVDPYSASAYCLKTICPVGPGVKALALAADILRPISPKGVDGLAICSYWRCVDVHSCTPSNQKAQPVVQDHFLHQSREY